MEIESRLYLPKRLLFISYLIRSGIVNFFEQVIKIRNVVEANDFAYRFDRLVGRRKQSIGVIHFLAVEILGHCYACVFFENASHIVCVICVFSSDIRNRALEIAARVEIVE